MKALRFAVCVLFVFAGSAMLMAQEIVEADLGGGEEVPGVATNASGHAVFWVYPDRIEFFLSAKGFGTTVRASHIHLGPPGVSGGIILPLFSDAEGAFTGRLFGVVTAANLVPIADRGIKTFSDAVDAVLGGRTYVNIHTVLVPSGEIRGQIKTAK